jgi:hypothetical protein
MHRRLISIRVGEEVVHLDQLAHERIEHAQQPQHRLPRHTHPEPVSDLPLDLLDDRPLRCHAGAGQLPHPAVRVRHERQARHDRADVRHEDGLVRRIERTHHVRHTAVHRGDEGAMQEALVDAGTVEGQSEDGRLKLAFGMRGQPQILLRRARGP